MSRRSGMVYPRSFIQIVGVSVVFLAVTALSEGETWPCVGIDLGHTEATVAISTGDDKERDAKVVSHIGIATPLLLEHGKGDPAETRREDEDDEAITEENVAAILKHMKDDVESHLWHQARNKQGDQAVEPTVSCAVIAVPSSTRGTPQAKLVEQASRAVGFTTVSLINQSTSAALAYSLDDYRSVHYRLNFPSDEHNALVLRFEPVVWTGPGRRRPEQPEGSSEKDKGTWLLHATVLTLEGTIGDELATKTSRFSLPPLPTDHGHAATKEDRRAMSRVFDKAVAPLVQEVLKLAAHGRDVETLEKQVHDVVMEGCPKEVLSKNRRRVLLDLITKRFFAASLVAKNDQGKPGGVGKYSSHGNHASAIGAATLAAIRAGKTTGQHYDDCPFDPALGVLVLKSSKKGAPPVLPSPEDAKDLLKNFSASGLEFFTIVPRTVSRSLRLRAADHDSKKAAKHSTSHHKQEGSHTFTANFSKYNAVTVVVFEGETCATPENIKVATLDLSGMTPAVHPKTGPQVSVYLSVSDEDDHHLTVRATEILFVTHHGEGVDIKELEQYGPPIGEQQEVIVKDYHSGGSKLTRQQVEQIMLKEAEMMDTEDEETNHMNHAYKMLNDATAKIHRRLEKLTPDPEHEIPLDEQKPKTTPRSDRDEEVITDENRDDHPERNENTDRESASPAAKDLLSALEGAVSMLEEEGGLGADKKRSPTERRERMHAYRRKLVDLDLIHQRE